VKNTRQKMTASIAKICDNGKYRQFRSNQTL